jgi:hypothetical protein
VGTASAAADDDDDEDDDDEECSTVAIGYSFATSSVKLR